MGIATLPGTEPSSSSEWWVNACSAISSLSPDWIKAVKNTNRFEGRNWDLKKIVPVTTLDALIWEHGAPAFVKIDVEGYEDVVFQGLTSPSRRCLRIHAGTPGIHGALGGQAPRTGQLSVQLRHPRDFPLACFVDGRRRPFVRVEPVPRERVLRGCLRKDGIMKQEEFQRGWALFASDERFPVKELVPRLGEDITETAYDASYVLHTAWAARVLQETKPVKHVDISSYVYFVALVSAFVPMESYDYRPLNLPLSGVTSGFANLTELPFPDNSVKSLSCMHTLEHVGLGRYGDPLDREGDIKAAHELQRVLSYGGDLLVASPMAPRNWCSTGNVFTLVPKCWRCFPLDLHEFAWIPGPPVDTKRIPPVS